MQLLKSLIILIVGFVLLIKGADFFVEGSSAVAKRLRIPSMIIGMTIVAMGTSLPECAVSVTASLTGNNSLAISNAVGSNIFNILMVLGIAASISPVALITVNLIDILVLIGFSILVLVYAITNRKVTRTEGASMVCLYLIYTIYIILR